MSDLTLEISNFKIDLNAKFDKEKKEITVNGYNKKEIMKLSDNLNLSFYEIACLPRRIINRADKLAICNEKIDRIINEIFTCSFCMSLFQTPVNIKDCLHKFCKKCIQEYNRQGKKECITCRKEIGNKRLMREDEKIVAIIKSFIPDMEKFLYRQENMFKSNIKNYCFNPNKAIKQAELPNKNIKIDPIPPENYNQNKTAKQADLSVKNIKIDFKCAETSNNKVNISLCENLINKKTPRSISTFSEDSVSNKKMRVDIEETYMSKDAMDKIMTNNSQNFICVKFLCDFDYLARVFSKLVNYIFYLQKLYIDDNISIDDISLYILNKHKIDCNKMSDLKFYVHDANKAIVNLRNKQTLKEIKQLCNLNDEFLLIHFQLNEIII